MGFARSIQLSGVGLVSTIYESNEWARKPYKYLFQQYGCWPGFGLVWTSIL